MLFFAATVACNAEQPREEDSADTAAASPTVFDSTYDVVVVGSGPAGAAAAIEATTAGASVVMFERETTPGRGVRLAGQAYGTGTPWQTEQGVVDSLEEAQADWTLTTGEDGQSESVTAYLLGTSETLSWLDEHGAGVSGPRAASGEGTKARIHDLGWPGEGTPFEQITTGTAYTLRTGVEVTGPALQDGAVVGVYWRDMATGETGATAASGGVVVATGGFLRDLAAVAEVRPDLVALDPIFETLPSSNGGGTPFFTAVGAARHRPEDIGAYVHSVEDPRTTTGEALILGQTPSYVLVGADGQRFIGQKSLGSFDVVGLAPEQGVWLVAAIDDPDTLTFSPPAYNWATLVVPEYYSFGEVLELGSDELVRDPDLAVAASVAGVDSSVIQEVWEYNDLALTSQTDEFGDDLIPTDQLRGAVWVFVRVRAGLAKNFGGVLTDTAGRVLTPEGTPVPGLWAAGECVGMVPGGGAGRGFSGSASALYYGGRLGGAGAAARRPTAP